MMSDLDRVVLFKGRIKKELDSGEKISDLINGLSLDIKKGQVPSDFKVSKDEFAEMKLMGIGISAPGIIDLESGEVLRANSLIKNYQGINFKKLISKNLSIPVIADNDVNSAMLYEVSYGEAKNYSNITLLSISEGVGASIIIDGQILRGFKYLGGEIGYLPLENSVVNDKCSYSKLLEKIK